MMQSGHIRVITKETRVKHWSVVRNLGTGDRCRAAPQALH